MKIRVKFSKHGRMRYIGHLDLQRYFQRANRRAGLKVVYSEGFSPHQKMSFAMPLSVGYESDGEYFDLEVTESASSEEIVAALNAQQTEGIEVISCVMLPDNSENAMASVKAAEYTICFKEGYEPGFDLKRAVEDAMSDDSFIIKKPVKKKKGGRIRKASYNTKTMQPSDVQGKGEPDPEYKEVDIRPYIYHMNVDEGGALHIRVSAGSENNIRPDVIMTALFEKAGQSFPAHILRVVRNELYTFGDDGKTLIRLGDVGNQF